jgi:hypothetical protein
VQQIGWSGGGAAMAIDDSHGGVRLVRIQKQQTNSFASAAATEAAAAAAAAAARQQQQRQLQLQLSSQLERARLTPFQCANFVRRKARDKRSWCNAPCRQYGIFLRQKVALLNLTTTTLLHAAGSFYQRLASRAFRRRINRTFSYLMFNDVVDCCMYWLPSGELTERCLQMPYGVPSWYMQGPFFRRPNLQNV